MLFLFIDIDECADSAANGCYDNSHCQNTAGSYTCSCPADFRLKGDGKTCECKSINMAFVKNFIRYVLSLKINSILWSVKKNKILILPLIWTSFSAIYQCASNHGCSHTCGKINGVDTCSCPKGYHVDSTGKNCTGTLQRTGYQLNKTNSKCWGPVFTLYIAIVIGQKEIGVQQKSET